MDELKYCEIGERLTRQSSTLVGKWRLKKHFESCKVCQEKIKTEEDMAQLFELAGGWEEDPEFAKRIKKYVKDLPVPQDRLIDRLLRRIISQGLMGIFVSLIFIIMLIIIYLFR